MSESRDKLIEEAESAITDVFNDRSVSQATTARDLRDLQGFIDVMLDTLDG